MICGGKSSFAVMGGKGESREKEGEKLRKRLGRQPPPRPEHHWVTADTLAHTRYVLKWRRFLSRLSRPAAEGLADLEAFWVLLTL